MSSQVYDAAICLAKYFEFQYAKPLGYKRSSLEGNRVIELGAGPGIVGMLASYYGASSVLTDLESLLPLLEYNCEKNRENLTGPVRAEALHWGLSTAKLQPPPDFLILANCVYYQSSLESLYETLVELSGESTTILACYELRCVEIERLIERWHQLISPHFDFEFVDQDAILTAAGARYAHSYVRVAILKLKASTSTT